jgi:hypothetical protein
VEICIIRTECRRGGKRNLGLAETLELAQDVAEIVQTFCVRRREVQGATQEREAFFTVATLVLEDTQVVQRCVVVWVASENRQIRLPGLVEATLAVQLERVI